LKNAGAVAATALFIIMRANQILAKPAAVVAA
jgi:hypothetical protein